jgi:hypothetical protein
MAKKKKSKKKTCKKCVKSRREPCNGTNNTGPRATSRHRKKK